MNTKSRRQEKSAFEEQPESLCGSVIMEERSPARVENATSIHPLESDKVPKVLVSHGSAFSRSDVL